MILVYLSFAFAYRIMMIPPGTSDSHDPNLTGNYMMNYDIISEIRGAMSIIDGSFDMYVGRYSQGLIPGGVALPYPPLTAYLQVPVVYAGLRLGFEPHSMNMYMLCGLPYIILSVICVYQVGVVLKKSLNVRDEMVITATTFLLLFSSLMFWMVTYAGRFEFIAALFLLLAMSALTDERYGLAGISLGLALMTKQIALPAVIVFMTVMFFGILKGTIRAKKTVSFLAMFPLPFAMLIPFWLRSPHDLYAAFIENQALLPILDVTFIDMIARIGSWVFPQETLREFLRLHSNSILLLLCAAFILMVAWKKKVNLGTNQFCALMALALLFIPTLAKYGGVFRYAIPASIFIALWGASRRSGFPYEALYYIVVQSFIMDHVPVIWKKHIEILFNIIVFISVYYMAFVADAKRHALWESEQSARD